MSRLPAEPAAFNFATIADISKDEETPSPPTGQEKPAHQLTNPSIPRDSRRGILNENEQSDVNHDSTPGIEKQDQKWQWLSSKAIYWILNT